MKLHWKQNAGAFLTSQLFSVLGSSLVQYSITWYITLQTKSGIYMTISLLCTIIPTLILSPFSGVWADRYNKRNLIIIADLSIAAVTLIAAVLFAIDQGSVIVLFIALFLRSLGQAIHNPAINSFIPELVPDEHLTKLNGINGTIQNFIQIIGPLIAALLISLCDLQYIFFIDIFTAIISTCIIRPFQCGHDSNHGHGYIHMDLFNFHHHIRNMQCYFQHNMHNLYSAINRRTVFRESFLIFNDVKFRTWSNRYVCIWTFSRFYSYKLYFNYLKRFTVFVCHCRIIQ